MLNDYQAPYFHFGEFANKHLISKTTSPYHGWSEKRRDGFLYDLAFLCSESAVPIGGCYHAKYHHEHSLEGNPFENVADGFFNDLVTGLDIHWPSYKGKVLLIFDRCEDQRWLTPLRRVHAKYAKQDSRFEDEISFESDTDPQHVPLQAADLYAYAVRQHAKRQIERRIAGDDSLQPLRVLDYILNKNLDPRRRLWHLAAWKLTVRLIREHQTKQKAEWARAGNPTKPYYPEQHFPYEKYGIKMEGL